MNWLYGTCAIVWALGKWAETAVKARLLSATKDLDLAKRRNTIAVQEGAQIARRLAEQEAELIPLMQRYYRERNS